MKKTLFVYGLAVLMLGMFGNCAAPVGENGRDLTTVDSFEKAVPVWAEGRQEEKNLYLGFRNVLDSKDVKTAIVRLAASTDYRMKVNGEFVSHGPSVAAKGFYRIDAYDIASFLHPGKNVLSIEVAGYNVPSYYLLNQPSFLQAEVVVNGKVVAATGDASFTAYELDYRSSTSDRLSYQRPTREELLLKPDYLAWTTAIDWTGHAVKLVRQEDKALLVRGVAYPDYTIHAATALRDDLFKFDCNSSGFLGMKLHVRDTTLLKVNFDELLGEDQHVHYRMGFDSSVSLDLMPGDYFVETFEPYTMQYVEFVTEKGDVDVEYVYMRDYCGSDVTRAQFHSSNEVLNRLFEAARETHRQNAVDIFTDCPSRERAGWLCDSYFSSRVAFDMSGNTRIEHNFLQNFLLPDKFEDIDEGMLPMCYPGDHVDHNYIANWAMWFVLELEEYLHRSGDTELVAQAKDRVYKLMDYFKSYLNEDGLLENIDKWVFVEWSAANSFVQGVNYPSNMLYARMLEVVASLYDEPALAEQAEQVRQAVRQQSYDGRFFCDNAVRGEDGKLYVCADHRTEACQYYAFYLKTATPELYPELWQRLRDEFGPIRHSDNRYPEVYFANAFIGNYLRLEILSEQGLSAQLLNECIAEYTEMANMTGTLWENMQPSASCNHGFAAHIERVLLRDILGLYDVSPVEKTVKLRFIDTGLSHCQGIIPVGDEEVRIEWHIYDGTCCYSLQLPKGYKAVIDERSMPNKRVQ